ncbi:MAG: hypothetical protein M3N18_06640 [Actinomycetota bacterium]|nr:hypothetical protein [Actinomycetota bacterium]
MGVARYYTVGAIVPDVRSLQGLMGRLDVLALEPGSVVVLVRRQDERLARVLLPEARVQNVESGLSRRQWIELASTFFSASTVCFLMGVVHLWTGLLVQAALAVAAVAGLVIYHRRPRVRKKLLRLGMPERLAEGWEASFPAGFALLLATVPEDDFDEAQDAFLEDDSLLSPLAVDRRPVL